MIRGCLALLGAFLGMFISGADSGMFIAHTKTMCYPTEAIVLACLTIEADHLPLQCKTTIKYTHE